jgi:histidinol-phosphate/aromatic aminotransferase/cobyric acid decarboxylase-like protein
LTKEHAIPGLRLGAVIASPGLIAGLERERPTWQVGSLAQAAAVACASPAAAAFVTDTRTRMLADRRALETALRARGCRTFGTATTFLLLEVGDAAGLRDRLLREHGVLVRDCTSFGLPALIRVGARPARDTESFLAAWDATAPAPAQ